MRPALRALAVYALTSLPVVAGVAFGHTYLRHEEPGQPDLLNRFAAHNGEWYASIVEGGYQYHRNDKSNVAFFPAYPLAARLLRAATGIRTDAALLAVSHVALAAAFVLLDRYLRLRWGPQRERDISAALLAFGLLPTTFFFRMGYSESNFVLLSILVLYGIERRWPLAAVALVVGLATAARPVGIALMVPWGLYVVRRSASGWRAGAHLALVAPVACWGLLAFAGFLWWLCGDPLAFVDAQFQWRARPPTAALDKVVALLTAEPLWSVYVPSSPVYWAKLDDSAPWLWSLPLANPLYFVGAAALILVGEWRKWLTPYESLFAVAALLLPYVLRSYEMGMTGHGRFAAAVFPAYLVLGERLARLPAAVAGALGGASGFLLGAYAALFATEHALA